MEVERWHEFETLSELSPESGCLWLLASLWVSKDRAEICGDKCHTERSFSGVANRYGTGCDH